MLVQAAMEELMHEELASEASMLPSGTSSGTVACAALFHDKEVILVNLGDCRAVVCESSKVATTTKDHSPDKNKLEKQVERQWCVRGMRLRGRQGAGLPSLR